MSVSIIQRIPSAVKVIVLCLSSIAIFFIGNPSALVALLIFSIFLYSLAGYSASQFACAMIKLIPFIAFLFVCQIVLVGWTSAFVICSRFLVLVLLANLVTTTTPASKLLITLEHAFQLIKPFGIDEKKLALAFSLTFRFIPLFGQILTEVREAQMARGSHRRFVALFFPFVVRAIKMQDDVAAAIEARSFATEDDAK